MADHGFSERRACRLIGVNRSAWQYEPLRGQDAAVRERMREIANERRRFGYRRLAILLKREGKGMNLKKVYRLYREERLTVRKRGGRKRALGTRAPMGIPQEPNQVGRSTSYRMRWPAAGGSACSTSSTTTAGNAWPASSIPRCQDGVSCGSWRPSPNVAGCRAWWSATTSYVGKRWRELASRSLCADKHRRCMQSEPDGFHRQRDRSLP